MLGFSILLLLLALPVFLFGGHLAFSLTWTLCLAAMNAPAWIWPMYVVYLNAEGFMLEAPLRKSTFYPTDEFVEVRVVDAFTKANTYLTFSDGKRYRVTLMLGFKQGIKLTFLDGPPFMETRKAANKHVINAIAAQQLT